MLRAISTFIKDPAPVSRLEDLSPGLNLIDGVARVEEPLRSPVRGQNCIAFFYRSFFMITGGRAPAMHKIKEAEVYASFDLEMEGGTVKVTPAKAGKFEHQDHLDLQQQYGKEFQGIEQVISPGDRVRLRGKAKRMGGEFVFKMTAIEVLEKGAVSAGAVGDRKKRRRKKK